MHKAGVRVVTILLLFLLMAVTILYQSIEVRRAQRSEAIYEILYKEAVEHHQKAHRHY